MSLGRGVRGRDATHLDLIVIWFIAMFTADVYYLLKTQFGVRVLLRKKKTSLTMDYEAGTQTDPLEVKERRVTVVLLPTNYQMLEKVVPQLRGDLRIGDREILLEDKLGSELGDRIITDGKQYDLIHLLNVLNGISYGIIRNVQDE